MKATHIALTLAVALVAVGCSHNEAPKPAAKKSVAETFATQTPDVAPAPPADAVRPVSPDQIPAVGVAPPGQVAFGPIQQDSGGDPAGDAWRRQYAEDRAKQVAANQAAANQASATPPPPPPPAPPATHKKNH
ncbi:MAG: hypothetical protein ABI846_03865 [Rudaea sp.]